METKTKSYGIASSGLGFGIFLLLLGTVFLGFNFGFLPKELKRVVFYWPTILLVIGVFKLFSRQYITSAILFAIGTFFMFPRIIKVYPELFPGFDGNFAHIYWPLLLIFAGIIIIVGKFLAPRWGYFEFNDKSNYKSCKSSNYSGKNYSNSNFEKNSVFGDGQHIVLDPLFTGGELNAVFGGITLDLRKTNLPEGDTHLEVNAVFGGVTIYVPETWLVEPRMDAVFGGFDDKRFKNEDIDTSRRLILHGACVFGGGELRN